MARKWIGDHEDDGSGRCQVCYEEWPCTNRQRGGWGQSGIQAWEAEYRQREYAAREAQAKIFEDHINAFFAEIGVQARLAHMSQSITFRLDDLTKILEYFSADSNR